MTTLKKDRYKLNRRFLICLSVSAIAISIIAIIIGIIALCFAAYRTPLLGFDYMGLLVGILAALVTALIGWQIFTTIGVEKKINDMEKKVDDMNIILEEEKKKINDELEDEERKRNLKENYLIGKMNFLQGHVFQSLEEKNFFMIYNYYVQAIYFTLKSDSQGNIQSTLNNMELCLSNRKTATDYDDYADVDIDNLNERINEIIMSESPNFTPDQRREFMRLDTIYREIWGKPKEE